MMIDYNNLPDSCGNELNCHDSQICKMCYSPARENKATINYKSGDIVTVDFALCKSKVELIETLVNSARTPIWLVKDCETGHMDQVGEEWMIKNEQ